MRLDPTSVDWSALEHAYGPATDVPAWLEQLESAQAKTRANALAQIRSKVSHQGWITPAAAPLVPFLAERFLSGTERGPLAILLGDFAAGGFHGNAEAPAPPFRPAIVDLHPHFVALLADDDAALRSAACVPLAVLTERAAEGRTALREAMAREKVAEPLVCMILALAQLGADEEDVAVFEHHARHRSKSVVLAARIASAKAKPTKANALAALAAAKGRPDRIAKVPLHDGELVELAMVEVIAALARAEDAEALAGLIETVGLERAVPAGLRVVLGPRPDARPDVPLALADIPQRAHPFLRVVASKIAARRAGDGGFYNDDALQAYGICDVERVAGLTAPRPLDGSFEGEPRWRIARRVLDGGLPVEAWPTCLRALSQAELEDLVRDLVFTRPIPYALASWWPRRKEGYDHDRVREAPYEALIAEAARLLDEDRLASIKSAIEREPNRGQVVPIVDVYTERLPGPPPASLDALLRVVLGRLHGDGRDVHRVLARVPEARRAALVESIPFDTLITTASTGPAVFLRRAWHFCGLVPDVSFVKRAAASLVQGTLVSPGETAVVPELVRVLREKMAALGPAGKEAFAEVLPRASPATAAVLEQVLG